MAMEYPGFSFHIQKQSPTSKARVALLNTPHGTIETPNFIFCATKAAIKGLTADQLRAEGSQICLSNTYHLMLTPGADLIEQMGGLQKMTGWQGPMLTDSGGYQIFSMGHGTVSNEIKGSRQLNATQTLLKLDETGATFRSYVDGRVEHLTPERSIQIQRQLGADLILVLDECTPFHVDKNYTEASMHRSHRWAVRCLQEFNKTHKTHFTHSDKTHALTTSPTATATVTDINPVTMKHPQALYGIIQGGIYEDLRKVSVDFTNNQPFFGMAIGGSLGGQKAEMHEIVRFTRSLMRDDRPIHLLGIGGVRDIFHGVRQGIDTFDCVHPTRLGRHSGALVMAAHWSEPPVDSTGTISSETQAAINRLQKTIKRETERQAGLQATVLSAKTQESYQRSLATLATAQAELKLFLSGRKVVSPKSQKHTVREHIQLTASRMRTDMRPIDSTCGCYTCRTCSRAYLHHLFKADESVGGTLVTMHNVHFMNRLMKAIR